jgi:hypothetical protein
MRDQFLASIMNTIITTTAGAGAASRGGRC